MGGKTGVNTAWGKNLLGAFHQPRMVLADTGTLRTLPPRQLRAGYAEIAKAGLIGDAGFFAWCEQHGAAVVGGEPDAQAEAIRRACAFKAAVVGDDEHEQKPNDGPGGTKRPPHPFVTAEGTSAMASGCEQCHAVGKPNEDGTIGTCTACHSRHTSSVALARLPSTCGQCHMGPDHSQIEIYDESKHGVMFAAQEQSAQARRRSKNPQHPRYVRPHLRHLPHERHQRPESHPRPVRPARLVPR